MVLQAKRSSRETKGGLPPSLRCMDSSPSDPSVVDSASKLLKDLRLVGRDRHGKNMDSMEMDLVMEVPDTPDRLAMMCPQEQGSEDPERKMHYRSHSNLALLSKGTRIGSSNASDNESLFRKARFACLISKAQDADLSSQPRGVRLGHEKESFRSHGPSSYGKRGIEKRGKVNEADKKLPLGIYPSRCGDSRRKMAQDLRDENEDGCDDHLNGMVSSSTGPFRRTHNGIVNSSELSDSVCTASGEIDVDVTNAGVKHCFKGSLVESSCNGNETGLSSDSQVTARKVELKPSQFHANPRTTERRKLVRNGCISPNNIANDESPSVNRESISSYTGIGAHDKGKGVDLPDGLESKGENMLSRPCQFDVPKKNTGQRRLVRNGCISPLNIANSSRNGTGKADEIFLPQLHVVSPDSEPRQKNKMKEKEFLNCPTQENGQEANAHMSSRDLLMADEDTTVEAEAIADIVRPADEMGWRSTRNRAGKAPQLPSQVTSVVLNKNINSFHSSGQHHGSTVEDKSYVSIVRPCHEVDSSEVTVPSSLAYESNPSEFPESSDILFELDTDIRRHCGSQRLRKGKRKSNSSRIYLGECSSSTFDMSEVRSPQPSGEPSSANSTRTPNSQRHGITFGPIIDVDKLSSPLLRSTGPRNGCYIVSEDSVSRAQQVESDEILARQLQEQLFNESPAFGGEEEIDTSIAWTIQQEENSQHGSFIRSRGQSHPRRYRQYPRQSSTSSFVQSTSRARINSSARMARLWRNTRHEMDLETRLNFLEALEAAFDNDNDSRVNILQIQRDFNENDYEMLLSLDDDNHHHVGASHDQINNLPQSIIQTDNIEESCAICLETPTIGDTIRHLPCLHKFHKDCIDAWLKRRTSCPICKSGIT